MEHRDSIDVANRILEIAKAKGISMSMMKLLKLVYFAHGWTLGLTGEPLCSDNAEAWQYGPVFRNLYNSLPYRGSQEVVHPVKGIFEDVRVPAEFTDSESEIIKRVVDVYGKLGAYQLSNITHEVGSPWDLTKSANGFFSEISNDKILDYFKKKAQPKVAQ